VPIVKIDDPEEASSVGLSQLPALVLFDNGIPEQYSNDLTNSLDIKQWIMDEIFNDDIDILSTNVLKAVVRRIPAIVVVFTESADGGFKGETNVKDVCEQFDISLARVVGKDVATSEFGLDTLPGIVYYENGIPSVFEHPLEDAEAVREWVEEQRTSDTIEEVTEEMLKHLVEAEDYLAVFFTGPCDERAKTDQECEKVLYELENIDDELDDFGITLVTSEDIKYAGRQLKVRKFPALGMFRNGHFLLYEGPLKDERELLAWLIDEETLEIPGQIEEVKRAMLKRLLEEEDHVMVLFYNKELNKKKTQDILITLEKIDDHLDTKDVAVLKCSDTDIAREEFGLLQQAPFLVLFENEVPIVFPSDANIFDDHEVFSWAMELVETQEVPMVGKETLEKLTDSLEDLVVIFYDSSKKRQAQFLVEIETVDEEAEKIDMIMVKVDSVEIAMELGIPELPSVVYFDHKVPNIYNGNMTGETVMNWLQDQKLENQIKLVSGNMLQKLVVDVEYVVALFLNDCDKSDTCEELISELEEVDDELDKLEIPFVYTDDKPYINKLKLDAVPIIGLFRNGDLIQFEGNIEHRLSVLKFVTDMDNLLLPDRIEKVSISLLDHIIKEKPHMFAFLYEEDDGRAQKIIKRLEGINDNLENDKVLLVKCSDDNVEDEYGIGFVPRLIYFENGIPEPFLGDLNKENEILSWISEELSKDEIKSVSRAVLDKLIEKADNIGVIFVDEEDEQEARIVSVMVQAHDELLEKELQLVQVDDSDYEEELGLKDLPALVHFSNDIPSIYHGEETQEAIMEWLIKMKTESVIEEVTAEIIDELKEDEEYVAVFFSGTCEEEACHELREGLESIDDELAHIGISFVQTNDVEYPLNAHGIEVLPALGIYRNGLFLLYEGSLTEEEELRRWFMHEDVLKIPGSIEEVNVPLLAYLYENDDDIVVFFYEQTDRDADEIVEVLEKIDNILDKDDITMVKIDDKGAEDQFGLSELPALVYIQNGIPNMYGGSLLEAKAILKWLKDEAKIVRIHEVTDIVLSKLVEKFDYLAAVFYDMEDDPTVENLQKIASECQKNGIAMVKINDDEEARSLGLDDLPQLVLYHNQIPILMKGPNIDITDEALEWVLKMQSGKNIIEVTDEMMSQLVAKHEYVAVYFKGDCLTTTAQTKPKNGDKEEVDENMEEEVEEKKDCDQVLAELETVDDELTDIGIIFLTTEDFEVATEHGKLGLADHAYSVDHL
jgi:hypothetical protein